MYIDNKQLDVLIFVEHKDRELEVACELYKELTAKYSLKVGIASLIYHPFISALCLRPKVIVSPSSGFGVGSVCRNFFHLYGESIEYINLNFEQFVADFNIGFKITKFIKAREIQKQIVWGQAYGDILKKIGYSAKNIFVTGRPLNTLIKNKYSGKKEPNRQELSEKLNIYIDKKWLFIALTDPLAFVSDKVVKDLIDSGCNAAGLHQNRSEAKYILKKLAAWLNEYKNSNIEIIIRPHPSVPEESYLNYFKTNYGGVPDNVTVTKAFNAYKWISASDVYITNHSTLIIEANLLNVPTYILNPDGFSPYYSSWYLQGLPVVRTFSDFQDTLQNHDNYQFNDTDYNYYIDTHKDAIIESSIIINKLVSNVDLYPKLQIVSFIKLLIFAPKRLLGSFLRFLLQKTRLAFLVRKGIEIDYFSDQEIKDIITQETKVK
jgi:surface carbohydrate biosynthesis protein